MLEPLAIDVSIVIPAHNEAGNIDELACRLDRVTRELSCAVEVVLVDDGSTDGTQQKATTAAAKYPFLRIVRNPERCGASAAIGVGFRAARGKVIVLLPADLESDPVADVPLLLDKMNEGYDVVTGRRQGRGDKKVLASWVANGLCRVVFRTGVSDMNWIKAFRREAVEGIVLKPGWHRFLVPIWAVAGYRIGEVYTQWHPRRAGTSKFGTARLLLSARDFLSVLVRLHTRPETVLPRAGVRFAARKSLSGRDG